MKQNGRSDMTGMSTEQEHDDTPQFGEETYNHFLASVRDISKKVAGRLHLLYHQFPDALPQEVIDWLQQHEDNPHRERRITPRFSRKRIMIALAQAHPPQAEDYGWVWDHSPRG